MLEQYVNVNNSQAFRPIATIFPGLIEYPLSYIAMLSMHPQSAHKKHITKEQKDIEQCSIFAPNHLKMFSSASINT